jgi:YggT family protein
MTRLICLALTIIWLVLLVRVILSWVQLAGWRPPASGPLRSAYDLMFDVTERPLRLLRRILPPAGMFDLSVVVAFIIVFVLQTAIC